MLWVDADNANHTLAVNHLALITNLFDGRTYLHYTLSISFIPVSYATAIQIVGRQLHQHPITRKNPDEMLSHLA
jgi:Na+/proline symporter